MPRFIFKELSLKGKVILSFILSLGALIFAYLTVSIEANALLFWFSLLALLTQVSYLPFSYGNVSIGGPFLVACLLSGRFSLPELLFLALVQEVTSGILRVSRKRASKDLGLYIWMLSTSEALLDILLTWVIWSHVSQQPIFSSIGLFASILVTASFMLLNIFVVNLLIVYVIPRPHIGYWENVRSVMSISLSTQSVAYIFAIVCAGIFQVLGSSVLIVCLILFFTVGILGNEAARTWLEKITLNQELLNREAFLKDLLESMDTGLVAVDQGKIVHFNSAAERILGENLDKGLKVRHIPVVKRLSDSCNSDLEEMRIGKRTLRLRRNSIHGSKGDNFGYIYLFEDVTEAKALAEYAMHKDRLSLLGQFAAGIMHEIGKPLTALSLAFEEISCTTENSNSNSLRILERSIDDLANLSNQLLNFGSPHPSPTKVSTELGLVIRDVVEITTALAQKKRLKLEVQTENVIVTINDHELRQVLLNLLSNAIDASTEGKTIFLHNGVGPAPIDSDPVWERDFLQGRKPQAWVAVEDEGPGFSKDILVNLGREFLTSKDQGHGLGMNIVLFLIKGWNGRIRIFQSEKAGTKVMVEL